MEQGQDPEMSQRMEQYAQELHDHFMRFVPEDFYEGSQNVSACIFMEQGWDRNRMCATNDRQEIRNEPQGVS